MKNVNIKKLLARDQEFFRTGEHSRNEGTSINILSAPHQRKASQGKILEIFLLARRHNAKLDKYYISMLLDGLKTALQMRH